jgi:trans-2-enoyl-CoA reductase
MNRYSTLMNTHDDTYDTLHGIQTNNIDCADIDVDEEINDNVYSLAAPQRLILTTPARGGVYTAVIKPTRSRVSLRRTARGLTVRRERSGSRREMTRACSY